MAIYQPGKRHRYSRILSRHETKRGVVVTLSLTAMVDMFTVLVIFLLQNFSSTGEIIYIPKEVNLPKAEKVKELKPAVVVTISNKQILVDKDQVATYQEVQTQEDWMITPLKESIEKALQVAKIKNETKIKSRLIKAMGSQPQQMEAAPEEVNEWNKVTVQADRGIDFQTIKKVLYTVTEAGGGEINFAVMKENR